MFEVCVYSPTDRSVQNGIMLGRPINDRDSDNGLVPKYSLDGIAPIVILHVGIFLFV